MKLLKLLTNPQTEYKKIIPFFAVQIARFKKWRKDRRKYPDYIRLGQTYHTHTPLLLQFGCSHRVLKGWINMDLTYVPMWQITEKDFPTSLRGGKDDFYLINILETGLPLPDDSVDAIFHEDFIEHLSQRDQVIFLAETCRVLKKGGVHHINTPELIESVIKKSDFSKGKQGVYVTEWNRFDHLVILTRKYIEEIALLVGYSHVQFMGKNGSPCPFIPPEYRPGYDTDRPESINLFADLIK